MLLLQQKNKMDTPNDIKTLENFLNESFKYTENGDYKNGLKYAALASVITDYPRADVCCQMGDLYMLKHNYDWAKFWYEKAIGNIYIDIDGKTIDEKYYTHIPMLRLVALNSGLGNLKEASEINESILKVFPNNEDAKHNKEILDKWLRNND